MAILNQPPLIRPRLVLKQVVIDISEAQATKPTQKLDARKLP
jgi:hypothetical protein